uniref:Uncharacterized protein n=1 Tax=Glycine max TaxID=3847 RepID=C6SX43_SOYBN|nr:unknown [Glycine max]
MAICFSILININTRSTHKTPATQKPSSGSCIQNRERRSGSGSGALRNGLGPVQTVAAVVPNGPKLVRRSVESEPLLHLVLILSAGKVGPSGGDLDVVKVPAVVRTRSVRSNVNGTDGSVKTGSPSAEDVEVAALEVVVALAHQAAPCFEVFNVDVVAVLVVQLQPDLRVRSALQHRTGSNVCSVHTIVVVVARSNGYGDAE